MGKCLVAVAATLALAGCASVLGDTESSVQVRTNPPGANCALKGQDGFAAALVSPAAVSVPHTASPVTVTCVAAGFRPTSQTLTATADGWQWGNGALIFGTAGVMILGAMIDESRGAGREFADEVHVDLAPDRPRAVNVRDRAGKDLRLQAR